MLYGFREGKRAKGQNMVEYALMLAIVVGIGWWIYDQAGLAGSIKGVFADAGGLLEHASKEEKAAFDIQPSIDKLKALYEKYNLGNGHMQAGDKNTNRGILMDTWLDDTDRNDTDIAKLPIAGVVKSARNYTLLTTDRILYNGTVFVSTALYHKMFEGAGSYHMEKEGYSSLNVKLAAGNNFSLRRSIASIATRRNGILSADNYDLISQSYTEGTQSAFLVGILAVFGVLLGCALLVVLNLSAYEVQQQRLSLLLTLGVSPKKLVLSYAKLLLPVIVGTTLLVNIVVYAAVSRIVPIQSILDLIRIHTSGRVFEFHKPVGSQIMVSILLMVFWLSAALLPIFSFIRKKASKGDIL